MTLAEMDTFTMTRGFDESGVSGVGEVLEGVMFSNHQVVVHWIVAPGSIGFYEKLSDFLKIHVESHPQNDTVLTFRSGLVVEQVDGELTFRRE